MKNEKWFALDIHQVEKKLKTNAASGLSRKAARSRWNKGSGTLYIPNVRSPFKIAGSLLADFALILLLLTAVLSLFFDDMQNGISVLVIALINFSVSFVICYRSQRSLESMESFFRPTARVIRDGKLYNIDYRHVVTGDVILMERGDVVCADVRLVTSDSLAVSMQVTAGDYIYLEKNASIGIRPEEIDAKKLANMVHAGSVIEKGSARGIVTAVGRYTYLGAMTGGIPELERDKIPKGLTRMKRFCSKMSMLSLVAVLPFCVISLLISQMQGAEVTLSKAFLTALAISASSMSQLALTLCKVFFILNIKKLVLTPKDPVAVRSTQALDVFSDIDYLFILDGSPFSDGALNFESAMTFDGAVSNYESPTETTKHLANMLGIYSLAERRSLSTGIGEIAETQSGIDVFCKKCNIDTDALKIRYPISYHFKDANLFVFDSVGFFDGDRECTVSISYDQKILSSCTEAYTAGGIRPLTNDGTARLIRNFNNYADDGKKVAIITLLDINSNIRRFVGMIALGRYSDDEVLKKIALLNKLGVKTIVFSCKHEHNVPAMPKELDALPSISLDIFRKKELPIVHSFGKYMLYRDVEQSDVLELLKYVHSQNKLVAILGFSDFAADALENADVFISCSQIRPKLSGYVYGEIHSLETDGGITGASCIQAVKAEADVLIPRASSEGGGLASIIRLRRASACSYRNLSNYFKYMICTQFMRLCAVAVPMLFGSISLDARHVMVCSFLMDLLAFCLFMVDRSAVDRNINKAFDSNIEYKKLIYSNKTVFIATISATAALVFVPRLFGLLGIGGQYLYEEGCSFSALIYLHLAAFFVIRFGNRYGLYELSKEKGSIAYIIGVIVFLCLIFLIEPLGVLFGLEMGNPFPYFLLSFVPVTLFTALYYYLDSKRN